MKLRISVTALVVLLKLGCTSGSDMGGRNADVFGPAAPNLFQSFTATAITFDGGIQALNATIGALAASGTTDSAIADTIIEGIVTVPSSFGIGFGTNGCTVSNTVYSRSFILQDANAGTLVAYGLEPPLQDVAQASSMKYITNARTPNMAVFGDRVRLTAKRAQNYGAGVNVVSVVTDFSSITVISSRNSVPYQTAASGFVRANDVFRVRRMDGVVTSAPAYVECTSGSNRQFQFNYQAGYDGTLCVGATSAADAASCTGTKFPVHFQLSYNLGAGTLSGFDTGNSFSYTIAKDSRVRITGPIFVPGYNQADSNLSIMLDQKFQVETLK